MTQPILCQTPTKGWLNLAYTRKIQFLRIETSKYLICYITWSNGDQETFYDKDASAIAQTWRHFVSRNREARDEKL